jgi:hypothetical protein
MDNRPPGYNTREGDDVRALERMLGTLDWGALQTAGPGPSTGHTDIAEQSRETKSHLQPEMTSHSQQTKDNIDRQKPPKQGVIQIDKIVQKCNRCGQGIVKRKRAIEPNIECVLSSTTCSLKYTLCMMQPVFSFKYIILMLVPNLNWRVRFQECW